MPPVSAVTATEPRPPRADMRTADRDGRSCQLLRSALDASDEAQMHAARDEVARLNMDMARSIAGRYRNKGLDLDDLVQVAYLALVKAVDRFRPDLGGSFVAFAVPTIRGEIKRYFRDSGWTIQPPRRVQEVQQAVMAVEPDLTQQLGRSPTAAEVADALDMEVDGVVEALAAEGCFHPTSLDERRPGDPDATARLDRLGATDANLGRIETHTWLSPVLAELSDREQRILVWRFEEGCTQAEIGRRLGVSQMQVSRLLSRLLRDLRRRLDDPADSPESAATARTDEARERVDAR